MSRLRVVAAAAALAALAAAPTASAHQGNPNFRSVIDAVRPAVSGVSLQVLNFDDRLELRNTSGRTVMVQGYDREPYARVLGDGTVQVNKRSPAYYLNGDRTGTATVPPTADPSAAPQWQTIDRSGDFQWHDHRIHWMGTGLPPKIHNKNVRTKIFDWKVPMQVGSSEGAIAGTLFYQPRPGGGPPVGAIAALVALALVGALATIVVRRRRGGAGGEKSEKTAEKVGSEAW
jgi:hypothetical protein